MIVGTRMMIRNAGIEILSFVYCREEGSSPKRTSSKTRHKHRPRGLYTIDLLVFRLGSEILELFESLSFRDQMF